MATNKPGAKQGNNARKKKKTKKQLLKERGLNEQMEIFCYEYIINDRSQKEAYMIAYPNCSERSAECNASRLCAKPEIQAEIDRLLKELQKSVELNEKMITRAIMDIAFDQRVSPANRLKALDKLAKIEGMYEQTTTVQHQIIKIDIVDDGHDPVPQLEDNDNGNIISAPFTEVEEETPIVIIDEEEQEEESEDE